MSIAVSSFAWTYMHYKSYLISSGSSARPGVWRVDTGAKWRSSQLKRTTRSPLSMPGSPRYVISTSGSSQIFGKMKQLVKQPNTFFTFSENVFREYLKNVPFHVQNSESFHFFLMFKEHLMYLSCWFIMKIAIYILIWNSKKLFIFQSIK